MCRLILDVVVDRIIPIGNDAAAHILEFILVIDDLGTEEGRFVLQSGFIYDNGSALGLDAFYDTLDGKLPEVV